LVKIHEVLLIAREGTIFDGGDHPKQAILGEDAITRLEFPPEFGDYTCPMETG
jgi:hypothetical protein